MAAAKKAKAEWKWLRQILVRLDRIEETEKHIREDLNILKQRVDELERREKERLSN
jgi:hypothetical protein